MKNIKNTENIGRGTEGWENSLATWSDSKLRMILWLALSYYYWDNLPIGQRNIPIRFHKND